MRKKLAEKLIDDHGCSFKIEKVTNNLKKVVLTNKKGQRWFNYFDLSIPGSSAGAAKENLAIAYCLDQKIDSKNYY